MALDNDDLKIEYYRASAAGGLDPMVRYQFRATHTPTMLTVERKGEVRESLYKHTRLRESVLMDLEIKVLTHQEEVHHDAKSGNPIHQGAY